MRRCCNSILALLATILACSFAFAADDAASLPADSLMIKCSRSVLWDQDSTSVAELVGPVNLELDHTKMSADDAVIWLSPNPGGSADSHKVEIALIGHAKLQKEGVLRLDRRLLVKAIVTGKIEMVGDRTVQKDESSNLYLNAAALRTGRPAPESSTAPATLPTTVPDLIEPTGSDGSLRPLANLPGTTQPTTAPRPWEQMPLTQTPSTPATRPVAPPVKQTISFDGNYRQATSSDGSIAAVCTDGVMLRFQDEKKNLLEFAAHDMVLFTNLKSLKGDGDHEDTRHFIADHLVAAYFDGDVRVFVTPDGGGKPELRMRAERVYYEFATDRAIMTDVLFHTIDIKKSIPIFMRADKLRQLSLAEFNMQNVEISSSAFTTPTFSLKAETAYVRGVDTGDPAVGERVSFRADDATMRAFGLPIFYFPSVSGTMSTKGSALRTIDVNDDSQYGIGLRTRWGLFESLGIVPPKDLDTTYAIDYLSKRGVAGGIDATYKGGFVSDTTKQPWNFAGDFNSYFVDDHGIDQLGAGRSQEQPEDTLRGRLYFEHQHFFPDDWQAQLRLGYVSDSNFMAQWFPDEYHNNLEIDESIYLKHAKDSEVFSFLAEAQPNRAISSANDEQENREISRLPEIAYYRVGDSVADDHLTFFSENSASGLKFVRNTQTLTQQGFYPGTEPGFPAFAYTGDPGSTTYRGDFREELDYPINAGPFRVVPYVFGRYTGYSQGVVPPINTPQYRRTVPTDTLGDGNQQRLIAGAGARVTTDFWKVDDSVQSDVFDLHRLRHIIEPELNVFASSSNIDQDRLYIYDPNVDAANDVQAVQLALRQRWQTKRGGPGRWRSVDFFTLNLYANIFGNQPENRFRDPIDFRGLFFYGDPETSIARNSANADATWRVSDSTAVLADAVENLDKVKLATASVGIAVQRDLRMSYYLGTRYIADLNSNIVTLEANYQLDRKYSLSASQSLDLAQNKDVYYTFSLTRNFDIFSAALRVYYDQSTNNKGFSINVQPFGAKGLGSDTVAAKAQEQ